MRRSAHGARGFTLVELLVVIGIIALLISILLPALSKAREQANSIACAANMRSIGQLINIYTAENKGMLPFGHWDGGYNSRDGTDPLDPNGTNMVQFTASNWVTLLLSMTNSRLGSTFTDAGAAKAALTNGRKLFFCPSAPAQGQRGVAHYISHPRLMPSLDNNDKGIVDPVTNTWYTTYKISKVKHAADVGIIFESSLEPYVDQQTGLSDQDSWNPHYNVPVGGTIDNWRYRYSTTSGTTYLTDMYGMGGATIQPNDPIDMIPPVNIGIHNAKFNNTDTVANPDNIRFRHLRNTAGNVLMVDGHVESFKFKLTPGQGVYASYGKYAYTTDLLRKNINVSP